MYAFRQVRRLLCVAVLAFGALALFGCGGGSGATGTVEGTVTIDNIPANSGEVVFTSGTQTLRAVIQSDGSYRAVGVPVGKAQVAVVSAPKLPGNTPEIKDMGGKGPVANPIPIPVKYATAEGSGLSTTVTSGTNKYPIPLSK